MASWYPIKLYVRRLPYVIMGTLFALLHAATWIWLLVNIHPQEEPIFLHYNTLFGVDLVGEWWHIVFIPITGLFLFLINSFLGWCLFAKDRLAAYVLVGVAVFCQLFLFIASCLLVFLNV